jgi:hypothetical protein
MDNVIIYVLIESEHSSKKIKTTTKNLADIDSTRKILPNNGGKQCT